MQFLFFALMFFLTPVDARTQEDVLPTLGGNLGDSLVKDKEAISFLELRRKKSTFNSNVKNFDVAGLTLGMTPKEIIDTAEANGFILKTKNERTPAFLEWQYKKACREERVSVHSALKKCANKNAEEANKRYIDRLIFEKRELKERLSIYFTSPFQGNKAFRIVYKNTSNHSWNNSDEGRYYKQKRFTDFWSFISQKYGPADDEDAMIWGNSEEGATLHVKLTPAFQDGYITLEDLTMTDNDSENMEASDKAVLNKFSF